MIEEYSVCKKGYNEIAVSLYDKLYMKPQIFHKESWR